MSHLKFGIVGTGMIAGVIADAIAKSENAVLTAVSGRQIATAQNFVANRPGVTPVQGSDALLTTDVQAVYVATPTSAKEEIALAAIAAGRHVLVDKPFASNASVRRMAEAAAAKGLLFMDATHFVHHPRTALVKASEQIGAPRSLHTTFYFPFSDRNNIRFDKKVEPMGAIGDMAWYSMRAVVEYLRPAGEIIRTITVPERDAHTGAVIRASGLIAFEGGEISTFDVGYTCGTSISDLQLLGTRGVIAMDDFVLDWNNSFAFSNPDIPAGYTYRTAMATRKEVAFIPTPASTPAEVAMIGTFSEIVASGDATRRAAFAASSLKTQEYVDAIWRAALSYP